MKRMPAIPKEMFSCLGSLPVEMSDTLSDGQEEKVYGLFDQSQRRIHLARDCSTETQWSTYFHEMVHVALWDSGVSEVLDHDSEELVCNTIGTHLAAAVRAGRLKVATPQNS